MFRTRMDISKFEDFYEMMDHVLVEYEKLVGDCKITNTTLSIAGPTNHENVSVTNIEGWEVNTTTTNAILADHGHEGYSSIVNDFEALGYGILYSMEQGFDKSTILPIHGRFKTGPARTGESLGTRSLVCGPGTGLGVACIVDDLCKDGFPYIISSEGGHHSISPETVEQYRFLSNAEKFFGKKSYEEALSHTGLTNMYNYFRKEDYCAEPNYSISTDEILFLAKTGKDQAATDAIELFSELLANFCGNAALSFNCDKAIFLWGGVLINLPIDLLTARFKRHYSDRCSHSEKIAKTPVVLMQNPDVPLLGCAHRSEFEVKYLMQNPAGKK